MEKLNPKKDGVVDATDSLNASPVKPFHVYLYGNDRQPIPTSFEESSSRLERLPLLHFEPDGSFVWMRESGQQQIYGMLYDAAGQIQYCELQGKCSLATWIELREAITGDPQMTALNLMCLPEQRLQDLQRFEETVWSSEVQQQPVEGTTENSGLS